MKKFDNSKRGFITYMFEIDPLTGEIDSNQITNSDHYSVLNRGNVIYFYEGQKNIYVGQTKHFFARHKQHIDEKNDSKSKKENKTFYSDGTYTKVFATFGKMITQGSLDDIERQMITYMTVDNESTGKHVDNGTAGNLVDAYNGQDDVLSDFISPFWNFLYSIEEVNTKELEQIKQSLLFKYSPFTKLTQDKANIIKEISQNPGNYVIEGLAGTGKTVILTNLVAALKKDYPNSRIAVVCKSNWVQIGKTIFDNYNMTNVDTTTALSLIRSKNHYDFVLVDEAHRLNRYYSKGNHIVQDIFKDKDGNYSDKYDELDMIAKQAKNIILFYDPSQSIRPNDIPTHKFADFLDQKNFTKKELNTEYRVQAGVTEPGMDSDDFMNGIQSFLQISDRPFNKNIFKSYLSNENAYFGIVESIEDLFSYLDNKELCYQNLQDRVLAGYGRKWLSKESKEKIAKEKKLAKKENRSPMNIEIQHDWIEGENQWDWNSTNENWISKKNSRNEIGSIHAIQGVDLDYAGVIISNDIDYRDGKVVGVQDKYFDKNGKFKSEDFDTEAFNDFIKNIYYVLLTRGIRGVRIYFENKNMENYFYNYMGIDKQVSK